MSSTTEDFCSVEEALAELRLGHMIVLVDDEYRENEGDLVIAAERVTPEAINFMLSQARGVLCLAMSAEICDRLHLGSQTSDNTSRMGTHFTVKFDARAGIETGTSAFDRCRTIQVATDPHSHPGDLVRPGHMDGLRANPGGVLVKVMVDLTGNTSRKTTSESMPAESVTLRKMRYQTFGETSSVCEGRNVPLRIPLTGRSKGW